MAKKTVTKETVGATPVRATNPTNMRVKSVKHSKAAASPVVSEADIAESAPVAHAVTPAPSAHDQIAKIAYGYWEARGFQSGCPEQDWLRAEQEYLLKA